MVDLKEKLEKMPEIEVRKKLVTNKNGTQFLVQETIIRNWTALNYIEAMKKNTFKKASELVKTEEDFL